MEKLSIICPHCFVKNLVPEERVADAPSCGRCREKLFTGKPVPVNGDQLQKMIDGNDIPVIVDFWASWCGPCRMFAPVFDEAAAALEPHARLLKVNTEQNQHIVIANGIRSIPTISLYQGGREVKRQPGAMPLQHFLDWATQLA